MTTPAPHDTVPPGPAPHGLFISGMAIVVGGLTLIAMGLLERHDAGASDPHSWHLVLAGAFVVVVGAGLMLAAVARLIQLVSELHTQLLPRATDRSAADH